MSDQQEATAVPPVSPADPTFQHNRVELPEMSEEALRRYAQVLQEVTEKLRVRNEKLEMELSMERNTSRRMMETLLVVLNPPPKQSIIHTPTYTATSAHQ